MRDRDHPIILTPNLIDCWRYEISAEVARQRAGGKNDAVERLETFRSVLTCLQRAIINKVN